MKQITSLFQILSRVVTGFILYLLLIKVVRKLVHFPVPALVGHFLDSDIRRRLQPAESIIRRSGIKSGMHVLG